MRRALLFTCALALLAGCPTVDLGEAPVAPGTCRPDPAYYRDVIWPEYLSQPAAGGRSCVSDAGCHQRTNGRSALRFISDEPLSDADHNANYNVVTRFLNCGAPEASPFLIEPLAGLERHGGGDMFNPGSAQETAFLSWF